MTRHKGTLGADYFEGMFRGTADPWDLETSAYEQGKFERTIAALAGRTYPRGFEIGCAKGVLTQKLAPRCDTLLSIDVSTTALEAARQRNRQSAHIDFERMAFPGQAPDGVFDLVVLSEVAYYWDDADLDLAGNWLREHVAIGGDILLVHYTGETDYPQSGDEAVGSLFAMLKSQIRVTEAHREPRYRVDVWQRRR